MFSSLSTLSSSTSSSSSSTGSAITEILDAVQSQGLVEEIPLTSKEETEKKLASIITSIQPNQVKRLNLASASLGRFYELGHTLRGHESEVYSLAVLPNGLLASGSSDNTIKLWDLDLDSHSCLATLQGHTDLVRALLVLPNGQLGSSFQNKIVKISELKTLSVEQLSAILNTLKNNTSVIRFDLAGNQDLFDDLIGPLMSIFISGTASGSKSNLSLKTIDLRKTGVSQKGVKKLEKAIQYQRLPVEVLADCPVEWMMIYFLIIFCRANRNSPFADSGLELCKYGELGPFLGVPSGFFSRRRKNFSAMNSSNRVAPSPS